LNAGRVIDLSQPLGADTVTWPGLGRVRHPDFALGAEAIEELEARDGRIEEGDAGSGAPARVFALVPDGAEARGGGLGRGAGRCS
jgi:kynurenine formamidase